MDASATQASGGAHLEEFCDLVILAQGGEFL
jgi:hypothetical protein